MSQQTTTYRRYEAVITQRAGPAEGDPSLQLYDAVAVNTSDDVAISRKPATVNIATNVDLVAAPVGSPCTITVVGGVVGLYHVQQSIPYDPCG